VLGCVAVGASALGAFVKKTGVTEDALLCFLAAALLVLPRARQPA
jgi:hypothetical protein